MIGFERQFEDDKKNEEFFAAIVRELTGDWISDIACDDIHSKNRRTFDEVIYFGPKKDLEKDGTAELLNHMSMLDRYSFSEQRVAFYVNEDPECREEFQLEKKGRYIVFLNGEAEPNVLTVDKDFINLRQLMFTLNTSVVKGTPRWGQRAYSSMMDFNQNAVIYYMGDMTSMEELRKDWRVTLMVEVNKWI